MCAQEVQVDQTNSPLVGNPFHGFSWIIVKTSHFVWSWTPRVYVSVCIFWKQNMGESVESKEISVNFWRIFGP